MDAVLLLQGYFVQPTVVVNAADNSPLMQDEIFGPVVCVVPFDSEAEVTCSFVYMYLFCCLHSFEFIHPHRNAFDIKVSK